MTAGTERKRVRAKPSEEILSGINSGIKVRRIGATWWGQKWIEALERISRDYLNRLGRGRSYARSGRVHDLKIDSGQVSARVTGSEEEPYTVMLRVAMLPPQIWQKVIEAMGQQALFAAELLSGQMPKEINQIFRAAGYSLFPAKQREIETDCSCSDWANPCKHVAAVHYVLGEAFDKDPFLLFELRGRTKKQVLGALSTQRSGMPDEQLAARVAARAERKRPTSTACEITRTESQDLERLKEPLPVLQFSFSAPHPRGLLSQIGAPRSWPEEEIPYATLPALYRAAGQAARDLALRSPASVNSLSGINETHADPKGLQSQ